MNEYFLRREPFGGVLYYVQEGMLRFINHTAYEICSGLASQWSDEKILAHVQSQFEVDDPALVLSDIHNFREILSYPSKWPKGHTIAINSAATSIPTLSAPLEIHWEITGKCNLKCLHCYNDSIAASPQPTMDQIRSVVNELTDAKVKVRGIIVSGGEPLMHKHLKEILPLLRPLTAELVLATNGTLINESNIDWILSAIDVVNLSVESISAEQFAKFRGHPQVLNKVVKALRLFQSRNTPVIAQTTVSRYNIEALDELALLLKSEGATSWIVRMPLRIGRANDNEEAFLTWQEARANEPLFERLRTVYSPHFDVLHVGNRFNWSYTEPFIADERRKTDVLSCAAGTMLATIRADGTMVPCAIFGNTTNPQMHSQPVWNGRFLSEWRDAVCFNTMRGIKLERIEPCASCSKIAEVCGGGCRALAFHSFGSVYEPDPGCNYVRALRADKLATPRRP